MSERRAISRGAKGARASARARCAVATGYVLLVACGSSRRPPGYTPYDEVTPEASATSAARVAPAPSAAPSAPAPSASAALPDACSVPVSPGTCEDSMMRWAFDAQRAICRRFQYTGCDGNANNFRTLTECESTCPVTDNACAMPIESGTCKASETRWAFDHGRQSCVEFTYTGCGGNENNFRTHDECEVACRP